MPEYIDREKIFPNGVFYVNKNQPEKSLDELINRICKAPAVDVVEVKHGYWRKVDEYRIDCSECCFNRVKIKMPLDYCPSCGAKIDGVSNG